MIIDKINLNHLRIFECVYRTKSMTTAAQELHLTQSGVSQHIKSLEDVIGVSLFDRIRQRLTPTQAAKILFESCSTSLYSIESTISHLKGGQHYFAGNISLGMPIEFGNNIILPLLSEFSKKYPEISYTINYNFASELNNLILDGILDFAIVDAYHLDKQIVSKKIYDEVWCLCASKNYMKKFSNFKEEKKDFENLDFLAYQPGEPVVRAWFKQHFKTSSIKLKVKAQLMDVQGIARLISNDLGVGILPEHLLKSLLDSGADLHTFKPSTGIATNAIRIAYIKEKTKTPAVIGLMKFIHEKLTKS